MYNSKQQKKLKFLVYKNTPIHGDTEPSFDNVKENKRFQL